MSASYIIYWTTIDLTRMRPLSKMELAGEYTLQTLAGGFFDNVIRH